MKFSQKRKAKMRKTRQKRIHRECKDMIGCRIYIDFKNRYDVEDQTEINGVIYLLTKDSNGDYAICKIVKVGEYVKLSLKRVLQNKEAFSNPQNWRDHAIIKIDEDGKIKSVDFKNRYKFGGIVHIYIMEA